IFVAVFFVGNAFASSISTSSKTLGSGTTTISRCDTDGVATTFGYSLISPYPITSVTVSGISSACAGKTVYVTIKNALTISSGSAVVPAGGGTVQVNGLSIAESDATQTEISVV